MIHVKPIANPQDMAKAFDIRRIVFVIEQECPPDEEYDEHETISSHFLATSNGLPAGTCRYRKTDYGYKLERFAVLKEHRTAGIGAALLQNCLKELGESGHILYLHATGLPSQQNRSDNTFRFKRAAFYMGLKSKANN